MSQGRKYHIFPKEGQGLILQAAGSCWISWVLSVRHLFRDAQDFAESKLWAIRLSMNINEMLSLYQMELSDKYSGCQAQKIVNLSHIPWQQWGNLLKTDLCNRNCTAVGYLIHVVRKPDLWWEVFAPGFCWFFFFGRMYLAFWSTATLQIIHLTGCFFNAKIDTS